MVDDHLRRSITCSDEQVLASLHEVHDAIETIGRDEVTIVAVTKGFDRSAIDCAARLGLADVGENYAQELLGKLPLPAGLRAHFIGRIQRNKVRKIGDQVTLWHSVSRPEILIEIARRSARPRALIQVAAQGDTTKDGVEPREIEALLKVAEEPNVEIAGLMTIGVHGDVARTRQSFAALDRLAGEFGLAERSMGMSGDYRDALEAGATMLRLGSVLFGPRPISGRMTKIEEV